MQALRTKFGYTQQELDKHLAYAREAGLDVLQPPPQEHNEEIIQGVVKKAWVNSDNDFKTFVGNMADLTGIDRKAQEKKVEVFQRDLERVKAGEMDYATMRGLYG